MVERKKIVEITEKAELPRLDFTINFGFDSADIEQGSLQDPGHVGRRPERQRALSVTLPDQRPHRLKGSDDYNLALSQRRADAVVQYLVSQHNVEPTRLKAIGFGEIRLKDVERRRSCSQSPGGDRQPCHELIRQSLFRALPLAEPCPVLARLGAKQTCPRHRQWCLQHATELPNPPNDAGDMVAVLQGNGL